MQYDVQIGSTSIMQWNWINLNSWYQYKN